MRISDWSSDVCSSDLLQFGYNPVRHAVVQRRAGFPAARRATVRPVTALDLLAHIVPPSRPNTTRTPAERVWAATGHLPGAAGRRRAPDGQTRHGSASQDECH